MNDEQQTEKQIIEAGATAGPRLTPEHIDKQITVTQFHRFEGTNVTCCCITLANGFNVLGHSACVSAENFNEAIGRDIAFKNAREKIWELEGYALCDFLADERAKANAGALLADQDTPLETSENDALPYQL